MLFGTTKVYAFVGPSGTGKSYRAQMVANEYGIRYIIDDGILIRDNYIVEGNSAKRAETKIETVKKAIFVEEEQRAAMIKALKRSKPESILILGTSDGMVEKIQQNLKLPKIMKTIYITDVATKEEIANAKRTRVQEGKHVIPVPTFEIKKDFSGYLLDPLQIFKTRKNNNPYIAENSIIRPTFSYIGNFTISDTVFRQIIEYLASKNLSIYQVLRVNVTKAKNDIPPSIYIEVEVNFGCDIKNELKEFKQKVQKELETQTAMNFSGITIVAKKIKLPNDESMFINN